ncbi:hypothetical protein ACFFLM_08175 [Deinococcus oregonensis]|uniref:Uncharacterized protein n=1 Tax=Deinococcus oregonensis TaxID=1805970 RepID=A0ABV6AWQ1_9DEIO
MTTAAEANISEYKAALNSVTGDGLEHIHKIAWRLYEQEANRADQLEKKGNYVLGFTGVTVSFFSGAAITAAKAGPWWVLIFMLPTLGILFMAVGHAYLTVKSQKYMQPNETAVLQIQTDADAVIREHTLDALQSTMHNRAVTNMRGGHLERAERLFLVGLGLMFITLAMYLVTAVVIPPARLPVETPPGSATVFPTSPSTKEAPRPVDGSGATDVKRADTSQVEEPQAPAKVTVQPPGQKD